MKKLYKNSEKCCVEMVFEELEILDVIVTEFNNIYAKHFIQKYPNSYNKIKEYTDSINKIREDKTEDITFCSCPKCGENFKFNELMMFNSTCGYLDKKNYEYK